MKKALIAFVSIMVLSLPGCESKVEPRYTFAWSYPDYIGYGTLEERFAEADAVVTGTVTNGNKTHVVGKKRGENWSIEKAYDNAYVIAEFKVDKIYKGTLEPGDIVDIKQENGVDDYVSGGYLAYKKDYILFLEDLGDRYQMIVPLCRSEIVEGNFIPELKSTAAGEIKTPEALSDHLMEILADQVETAGG